MGEGYVDPMVSKISMTKEAYVDPVVEKTTKVVHDYKESAISMKNSHVDPAIAKASTVKDSYVNPAMERVSNVKDSYVNPAIERVNNVKDSYVNPAIERVNTVKDNYVAPAITKAYQDPKQAYNDAVGYSKGVINSTKMQGYMTEAGEAVRQSSRKSLDRAITFAKQTRDTTMKRAVSVLVAAQATIYERLHARFPAVADLIDQGISGLT